MWHRSFLAIMLVLVSSTARAEDEPTRFFQLIGTAGAGVIINSGGGPNVAFGGGVRWVNYFNEMLGLALGAEYSYRGAYWHMHCLDAKATLVVGRGFFGEIGFYGSYILASVAKDFGWDNNSNIDAGGMTAFGYNFDNGLSVGVNGHFGLVDLTEDRQELGGGLYAVNQTGIHWGAFLAYRL